MNPALLLLWAPLAAAAAAAIRSIVRERDSRMVGLLLALALLAARHFFDTPPELDAARLLESTAAPFLVDLTANFGALLVTLIASRTLHERNRAEGVQWNSMEALRAVTEHLRAARGPLDAQLPALLQLGCEQFGFETGLLVHCPAEGDPVVLFAHTPDDVALGPGPRPELTATLIGRALGSERIVSERRASDGHWIRHPEHAPFGWESFLGARLSPDGARDGPDALDAPATRSWYVLCFADRRSRTDRLSRTEQALVGLLAEWIAPRLPQPPATTNAAPAQSAAAPMSPDEPARRVDPVDERPATARTHLAPSRPLDLNAALRALEPALRSAIGTGRELGLELDDTTPAVAITATRFERFAESLARHAADSAPGGGAIRIQTGRVAPPDGSSGTRGFATVSVRAEGAVLTTDALTALYEGRGDWARGAGHRQLPLAGLARVLREHGGDLSVQSEDGVGTTLTLYLAAADRSPVAREQTAAAAAVTGPASA